MRRRSGRNKSARSDGAATNVSLGFVGRQIVKDGVDLAIRVGGHGFI
jgi:hypothetical protein